VHLPALSTPADPAIDAGPDGKVRVSITHSKLTEPAAVEHWKAFWASGSRHCRRKPTTTGPE